MHSTSLPTKSPVQVIDDIRTKLADKRSGSGAAYAMIVGAGFSYGSVPLTKELLHEHIGDFYYPDQDMSARERSREQCRKLSADYWKEFNAAASHAGEKPIETDDAELPANPSEAYQHLFSYRVAKALFSPTTGLNAESLLARLQRQRDAARGAPAAPLSIAGEKFVKEFLHYVLDPRGYYSSHGHGSGEGDYCTTGRTTLNGAHFFLASLLELQQSGQLWKLRPFCRTIFTTNFDTLLQDALQLVNVLYSLTDRPERGLDQSDFPPEDPVVHLVYTHGSILRHNAASTVAELAALREKNLEVLKSYLEPRDVLVIGYGGWDDSLRSALARCSSTRHRIYWCGIEAVDAAERSLAPEVLELLRALHGNGLYVSLGSEGADGFMARLYQSFDPEGGMPRLLRDPVGVFLAQLRMSLGNLVICPPGTRSAAPAAVLPTPKLEAPAARLHGSICRMLDGARAWLQQSAEKRTSAELEAQACALLEEGFIAALTGRENDAVQTWSRLLALQDAPALEVAIAANYLGIVRVRQGRNDLAITAYTRAIDLESHCPSLRVDTHANRGAAHHQNGEIEKAMDDFSAAVAIWEDQPPAVANAIAARALIFRGVVRREKGDILGAQDDFNRAVALKDVPAECAALIEHSPA